MKPRKTIQWVGVSVWLLGAAACSQEEPGASLAISTIPLTDSARIERGVLFTSYCPETHGLDLFLADPERGARMNLTQGRLRRGVDGPWEPVGSPDGRSVLIRECLAHHQTLIYVLDMDDLKIRRLPETFAGVVTGYRWTRDSKSFAFRYRDQLVVVDRESLRARTCNPAAEKLDLAPDGKTSADGKYVVLEKTEPDGKRQLWIQSVADGSKVKVDFAGDCTAGVWAPDRNLLAFWGYIEGDRLYSLLIVGSDGKNPRCLGKAAVGSGFMPPSWLSRPPIRPSGSDSPSPTPPSSAPIR